MDNKLKIGFIGLGVMGSAVAEHLLTAGFFVTVTTRTKSKAAQLLAAGAHWAESASAVVAESSLIFTMVGFPSEVEDVYFGEDGIFSGDVAGKMLVDMTTSTPTLAKKIAAAATAAGAQALDAPVSGGDLGARAGTLTVMVGGAEETLAALPAVFATFARSVTRFGGPGAGQHAKMANQIIIAGTMTGLTEMLVYADAAGLDLEKVLATLAAGAAGNWSLTNYAPRILRRDYTPGFFVKHFVKDLKIALDESEKLGLNLPATQLAAQLYEQLQAQGHGDDGTQSLVKLFWPDGRRPDSKK